jgi:Lipase (class 3).
MRQPRVGNHAFTRFYKAHVPHTFRVVAEGDAITSLPLPTSCPPALYKHAGLEVILDEGSTGNILVGPTVVETLFRFSKVRTNMFAHLMEKYRDGLESALTHDELQEVYRTHGVDSRSFRSGYNTSDLLPDWVTHISRRNF